MSIIGLKTKNGVLFDGVLKYPSITLPIPYDANSDLLSLIIDISQDGQFVTLKENFATATLDTGEYCRISMANETHRSFMKIFQTDHFVSIPPNGIGATYYDSNIVLTINPTIFPPFDFNKTYYARYTWVDTNDSHPDWKGFILKYDVQDFAHPQFR